VATVTTKGASDLPLFGVQIRFARDALKGVESPYSQVLGIQLRFALTVLGFSRRYR
jgi:hypothetical protein